MEKEFIHLSHLSKSYDGTIVLDDLDLRIRENEFMTLLGPSGCGKTTTLRLLGGFELPDQGQIFFDGADITTLPPNERKLNTVFQKYALFPHMSIAENIAFGLKTKRGFLKRRPAAADCYRPRHCQRAKSAPFRRTLRRIGFKTPARYAV